MSGVIFLCEFKESMSLPRRNLEQIVVRDKDPDDEDYGNRHARVLLQGKVPVGTLGKVDRVERSCKAQKGGREKGEGRGMAPTRTSAAMDMQMQDPNAGPVLPGTGAAPLESPKTYQQCVQYIDVVFFSPRLDTFLATRNPLTGHIYTGADRGYKVNRRLRVFNAANNRPTFRLARKEEWTVEVESSAEEVQRQIPRGNGREDSSDEEEAFSSTGPTERDRDQPQSSVERNSGKPMPGNSSIGERNLHDETTMRITKTLSTHSHTFGEDVIHHTFIDAEKSLQGLDANKAKLEAQLRHYRQERLRIALKKDKGLSMLPNSGNGSSAASGAVSRDDASEAVGRRRAESDSNESIPVYPRDLYLEH